MSNYFNEAGEPLMDGSAMRYEMYLDSTYEPEFDPYDGYADSDEWCEGGCGEEGEDFHGDPERWLCTECAGALNTDEGYVPEDQYLDSYMEDRISEMYI